MKNSIIDLLVCPSCLPWERKLIDNVTEMSGEDILSGYLRCPGCDKRYPILEGTAFLTSEPPEKDRSGKSKYETPRLLASYVWSHFSDLMGDEDANKSYRKWSETITNGTGFALDAGCAVGRFTYELSSKFDFAIGIDNSKAFIHAARKLMKNRSIQIELADEGLLTEKRTLKLPGDWDTKRVEYIVGDVQKLPFKSNTFSLSASLNLLDRIPFPLLHLKEIDRVSQKTGSQFLFSDPFSWSEEITRKDNWLGGKTKGGFTGKGIDNVSALLEGYGGEVTATWRIKESGQIWWKIRNHRNHFELIRSHFLKADR